MERRKFLKSSTALGALAGLGLGKSGAGSLNALAAPGPIPAPQDFWKAWGGTVDPDYQHAPPAAVERWRDWKFGMRIHFGVYSVLSLDASVSLVGSSPEFQKIYFTLYEVFDPTAFDADQWADLAQRAGMKYFVMPTRHADGFSMYDTKTRVNSIRRVLTPYAEGLQPGIGRTEPCFINYSVMDTPFKKDIVGALVDAFRKRGMGIGLYFNWTDFHDPDFRGDNRSPFYEAGYSRESHPKEWKRFMQRVHDSVREICTQYGKFDILSFDQGLPPGAQPEVVEIVKMARSLQPDVMMRNRGIGPYADYSNPEHWVPIGLNDPRVAGIAWEAIDHLTTQWAYEANEVFKPKEWVVSTLVDAVSKGGNFMPGVSPLPNGAFPQEIVERLEYAGKWLKVNAEAIYGTRPWNVYNDGDDVRFTRTKDGRHVYAISLKWPGESLTLRALRAREGSRVTILGVDAPLKWRQGRDGLVIQIPDAIAQNKPCEQAFAFRIEAQPYRATYG
ncbi:MAG: alpha-L-fucosidase, partial [Terriglobia bacterium]|jgi:alpha-L-fucosidase